jgi:hypothetical protein
LLSPIELGITNRPASGLRQQGPFFIKKKEEIKKKKKENFTLLWVLKCGS